MPSSTALIKSMEAKRKRKTEISQSQPANDGNVVCHSNQAEVGPFITFNFDEIPLPEHKKHLGLENRLAWLQYRMSLSKPKLSWNLDVEKFKHGYVTLDELQNEFEKLCELINGKSLDSWLTKKEKATLEQYKLAMIQAFEGHLKKYVEPEIYALELRNTKPNDEDIQAKVYLYLENNNLEYAVKNTFGKIRRIPITDNELDSSQRSAIKRIKKILHKPSPAEIKDKDAILLNQITSKNGFILELAAKPEPEKKTSFWRRGAFGVLITVEILPMVIGGLVYAKEGLEFLPVSLPDPVATIIGVVLNVIEVIMIYGFIAPILKERLGIVDHSIKSMPQILLKELTATQNAQAYLNNTQLIRKMSATHYEKCAAFDRRINQNILDTNANLPPYKESIISKGLRWLMIGINLVQSAGGAWFMAKALLIAIAPALLATPVGWVIAGVLLASQLLTRFIFRSNGVFDIMNPYAQQHAMVKAELNKFVVEDDKIKRNVMDKNNKARIASHVKELEQNAKRKTHTLRPVRDNRKPANNSKPPATKFWNNRTYPSLSKKHQASYLASKLK